MIFVLEILKTNQVKTFFGGFPAKFTVSLIPSIYYYE